MAETKFEIWTNAVTVPTHSPAHGNGHVPHRPNCMAWYIMSPSMCEKQLAMRAWHFFVFGGNICTMP